MKRISIAIPTFNRFEMVKECIQNVLGDPRIDEIIICDDASTDESFYKLSVYWLESEKVQVFSNTKNLDCYANKAQALRHATNEWAILFDSDNVLGLDYVNRIFQLPEWDPNVAYLPVFAQPSFDYRAFEGRVITKENINYFINDATFRCALNTANYFVHRRTYLDVWDGTVDPHTADSIYMNYRLLAAGKSLMFVPGLQYLHRVHDQSHYKRNCHKTGNFYEDTLNKLRALK